jgi:hypothetical protein
MLKIFNDDGKRFDKNSEFSIIQTDKEGNMPQLQVGMILAKINK